MAKQLAPYSLAWRVTMFFARNPEEELTSTDIVEKFGVPLAEVHGRLNRAVSDEMLSRTSSGPGRGRKTTYSAGRALLESIGERKLIIAACMPVGSA
jgi:hypothetical protein